jgi:16S rRNA (cytosine967-C5)-methyltransferase
VTPGARLQAAIALLDQIAVSRQPADQVLRAWGGANRYAGSKDRRAVAERVYLCLRAAPRMGPEGLRQGGRGRVLASLALQDGLGEAEIAALFSGQGHAPEPLTPEEIAALSAPAPAALPPFLEDQLRRSFGEDWPAEAEALLSSRAPLDIRINDLKATVEAVSEALAEAGLAAEPTPWSAFGLRLSGAPDLAPLDVFKSGALEVQDEGSQIAAWLTGAERSETVVDYCAGGGGKTLALGQAMRGSGRLIACDLNPRRLDAIKPRLLRAGVHAEFRRVGPTGDPLDDLQGQADRVLVDAPCSGSGTWRRRPEEAWRLTEDEIRRLSALQLEILNRAADLVRPGGRLVYVTCSVLADENAAVTDAFCAARPDFTPLPIERAAYTPMLTLEGRGRLAALAKGGHRLQLSPLRTGTDGFFIALYERIA